MSLYQVARERVRNNVTKTNNAYNHPKTLLDTSKMLSTSSIVSSYALSLPITQNPPRIKSFYKPKFKYSIFLLVLASGLNSSNGNPNPILTSALSTTCNKKDSIVSGGLINLGNTCYLNAQLECAYHIPKVRNFILDPTQHWTDDDNDDNEEPSIGVLALQQVFQSMYTASQRGNGNPLLTPSASTAVFCRSLGISTYEQQDSQEFWKLLLPALDHTPLTELYKGELENYIQALDGSGREKIRKEIFLDLSLDVSNFDDTYDSITDMFTNGEVLSVKEGNGWRPEKGADRVDALKGQTIGNSGLPKILQLHLMRFKYDMMTGGMSKINDRFAFQKVSWWSIEFSLFLVRNFSDNIHHLSFSET